jgi:hypothetical protein
VRGVAALGVLAAIAVVALTARASSARLSLAGCGGALRRLETLSDRQRKLVRLQPRDTTVAAIAERARPTTTPLRRTKAFARQVWRVPAQITDFRLEPDGDVHLILFDASVYGTAEMPASGCLTRSARDRQAIVNTRQRFVIACGQPTNSWKPLGVVVNISGVGFWNRPNRETKQQAPNFAELDPVTDLQIVAGCR